MATLPSHRPRPRSRPIRRISFSSFPTPPRFTPPAREQVSVSPQPLTYSGATGSFFVARQKVTLTATPTSGWKFYEFNNSPFWLPGGLGLGAKDFLRARYRQSGQHHSGIHQQGGLRHQRDSRNIQFESVHRYRGRVRIFPKELFRTATIPRGRPAAPTPSPTTRPNIRIAPTRAMSSIAGAMVAPLPIPSSAPPQYKLRGDGHSRIHARDQLQLPSLRRRRHDRTLHPRPEMASIPPASSCNSPRRRPPDGPSPDGPTISPARRIPRPSSQTVRRSSLRISTSQIHHSRLTGLSPSTVASGSSAFTLTLTGTGFAPGSLVAFNGNYLTPTYVSSTELTVSVPGQ